MSVLIKHMAMPKGCIYANDKDNTEYCPLLNHNDVPFCQYVEDEPEAAIGIDERPIYCPLEEQPEHRWIPVSDRLPEYGKSVLCYFKEDEDFGVNHVIDEEDGEWFIDGVTAWMPLPEPYREEGDK